MITLRAYSGADDLQRLIDFLIAERQRQPIQRWHVGDLVWRTFYSDKFNPARNIRLWEENGEVVGFGFLYPPNGADLHPRDVALLPEMIVWAQANSQPGEFYVATLDTDQAEIAWYEAQGFQAHPPFGYHLRRPLESQPPAMSLPSGFIIRPIAGESEVPARAAIHRLAFESQAVTDAGYRKMIQAPLYQRDLDLLVIAPDGRIAAFCLCWLDTVNRVGLFEPVGTHPDFRRMGLASAVMHEGMRRMQARGMDSALVSTASENAASTALYQSLGFRLESGERVYVRP
jgi:ribosomal protein S18 acetylase RimI-like enzyme